jgi:hypothetical protein
MMDFDITEGPVDIADHKKPPHIIAKNKIIKGLRDAAKKLASGKEVRRTMKYVDNASRLDIAIYYGVERVAPAHPDHYYKINCDRSQIVEAIDVFIKKELNNDKHDATISNKLSLFQSRTKPALEKARGSKLPSAFT